MITLEPLMEQLRLTVIALSGFHCIISLILIYDYVRIVVSCVHAWVDFFRRILAQKYIIFRVAQLCY